MRYEIKEKIYSDSNLLKYLRENSSWYKFLNRRLDFNEFVNEMKKSYGLRFRDKVDKVSTGASLLRAFMSVTKE